MSNSKTCPKCGQVKPLSEFRKNKSKRLGVSSYCKPCANQAEKDRRPFLTVEQRNADRANSKKWYKKNKPNNSAWTRAYLDRNPGLRSHYISTYRARKRNNGVFKISSSEIRKILDNFCFYCNSADQKMTLDHVVPISRGGRHSIGNVVAACSSCNFSKGAKFITEWKKTQNAAS